MNKPLYKEIEDVIFIPEGKNNKSKTISVLGLWFLIFVGWIVFLFFSYAIVSDPDPFPTLGDVLLGLVFGGFAIIFTFAGSYELTVKDNYSKLASALIALLFTGLTFFLIYLGALLIWGL